MGGVQEATGTAATGAPVRSDADLSRRVAGAPI